METMKDTHARRIAVVALFAAIGAFMLGSARADSISEPDAYVVQGQVAELQERIDLLEANMADMSDRLDTTADNIVVLDNRTNDESVLACLATSDFHYYKERVDGSKKRFRLPVMLWNASLRQCRPSAKPWRPHGRVAPVRVSR